MPERIIAGLDIGTTKICAMVGEVKDDEIEIIGVGTHPSEGLRKGVVINIEKTVESIKRAVEEAEYMSGCEINSVYTGIAGGHIHSFNSEGVIPLKNREVTRKDIERVIEAASAVAIPTDREVIHILTQEFIVDGQDGILDPLGMSGVRLEVKVHIVTGAVSSAQNIVKCVNRAGLDIYDIVLETLASSEAVLTEEEKKIGVALIDFGGGTTDTAVFSGSTIKYSSVLSLGGNNVTYDLSIGLRTPISAAERIKIRYGCAMEGMIGKEDRIQVPDIGGKNYRSIPRSVLGEIIEPRVEEIFTLIYQDLLKNQANEHINAGIVITGGSAELSGVSELAEKVFGKPIRVGYPKGLSGDTDFINKPMYSTAVGLVLYGAKKAKDERKRFGKKEKNIFFKVMDRMKRWFQEII